MKAVVVSSPGKVEIRDLPVPVPGPYQALVKTEAACLCNATDSKLVAGKFPGVEQYPLALGHESVGIVTQVGDKVRHFQVGDRVVGGLVFNFGDSGVGTGWGGFCEYTLAADHEAMKADGVADAEHGWFECYEIQTRVEPDIRVPEAVLLCTWREVYGAFADFHLKPGMDLLIHGGGAVGLSFVKFARLLGLGRIILVDRNPGKRERALALGADAVLTPGSPELAELCAQRKFDAVIDAVGSEEIINAALGQIKMGGSICVYGVLSQPAFSLVKDKAPYNFNLLVHQWPTRAEERAAQGPLCDWIRQGKLNADDFITHEFPISDIAAALEAVAGRQVIKALLRY